MASARCSYCQAPAEFDCGATLQEGRPCGRSMCRSCTFDGAGDSACREHRAAGVGETPGVRFTIGSHKDVPLELVPSSYMRWALRKLPWDGPLRGALRREIELLLDLRASVGARA